MPSLRVRLVACLTIFSYVVMNVHAGLGLCAAPVRAVQTSAAPPKQAPKTKTRCKHCASKHTSHESAPTEHSRNPDQPCDDSCPGCPKTPGKPCHVPGGCVLCSVAKVPCVMDLAPLHDLGPCLGDAVSDLSILYISPRSGGLIRPPRA